MMKYIFLTFLSCICLSAVAQNADAKLAAAIKQLEADAQFKHAILSLYVVDSKTGKVIFDKNAQVGLAPASCQKVVTSVSAFELMGRGYRYKTELRYSGNIKDSLLKGNLYLVGYGDPTLGSWRYKSTGESTVMKNWITTLQKKTVKNIEHFFIVDDSRFSAQLIPGGWVWEDVGNYYGAGAGAVNWRENQFDLVLKAGDAPGMDVAITSKYPKQYAGQFINELQTGAKGSGDNAYIYLPVDEERWLVKGTIPAGEKSFKISGAIKDPATFLWKEFGRNLDSAKIFYQKYTDEELLVHGNGIIEYNMQKDKLHKELLDQYFSPPLDSINYWFLKKSINLYGEAFVKTIAYEKLKFGSTDSGIAIIKNFWQQKGIEPSALNIIDGSGLSPANRVTTNALVSVLQYAKQQPWFPSFYFALPEMNGIKMKDGYISGVRSYTGYIKSKTGNEYIFSFIVNNFDGSPGAVREKMWKVLDILK
jgi:serine-type D-Ala-D-Ala carboxypeptidase/endopeptidase (penicillin-binding protein 4)